MLMCGIVSQVQLPATALLLVAGEVMRFFLGCFRFGFIVICDSSGVSLIQSHPNFHMGCCSSVLKLRRSRSQQHGTGDAAGR